MLRQFRIWQWISDFSVYLHMRIYGYIKTRVVTVTVALTHFMVLYDPCSGDCCRLCGGRFVSLFAVFCNIGET
jgi:hypothetical protein